MPNQENSNATRIPGLDGFRAISVIIMIAYHVWYQKIVPIHRIPLLTDGIFAVNIFFFISGYLITELLLKEEKLLGRISYKNFLWRRCVRLLPAYLVLLLIYGVLQFAGLIYFSKESWFYTITLSKYLHPDEWLSLHLWTLAMEWHFYLLWPFIFMAGNAIRTWFCIIVVVMVPFLSYMIFSVYPRFDELVCGCLFAIFSKEIKGYTISKNKAILIFAGLGLIILGGINQYLGFKSLNKLPWQWVWDSLLGPHGIVGHLLIAILVFCSMSEVKSYWGKFLNSKIMVSIGTISYSLYLYQQFFTQKESYLTGGFPFSLVLLLITAWLSYSFIEKPTQKLLNN